ncbi:MAG: hypothetical protein PUB66_08510 [Oscillospiraceae bacterium]|nr:hypothetical protein [Ruminococcus sp.]MDD6098740.1 hypothetical protein [Oscillospiraceae bacterium]
MMNNKSPKNSTPIILAFIVLAGLTAFIAFFTDISVTAFIIADVIVIFYVIISVFKEKKSDKKAAEKNAQLLSSEYYNSVEFRESVLNYAESHGFEKAVRENMRSDLKKRFINKNSVITLFIGLLLIAGPIILIDSMSIFYVVAGICFGLWLIISSLKELIAYPVMKFYKECNDISAVEASYMTGKMLTLKAKGVCSGINIGSSYTLIYNLKDVHAFRNDKIISYNRKIERIKKYENSIFSGDEYRYYLALKVHLPDGTAEDYFVELNKYQLEMTVDEMSGISPYFISTDITEKYDNNVAT